MKKSSIKPIQKKLFIQAFCMLLSILLVPVLGYTQPPPPTGGTGGGSLPDSPLSVPFDNNMSLLLLAVGIVFAVVIMRRSQKNKAALQTIN